MKRTAWRTALPRLAAAALAALAGVAVTGAPAHATPGDTACTSVTFSYDVNNRVSGVTAATMEFTVTKCEDAGGLASGTTTSLNGTTTTAGDFLFGASVTPGPSVASTASPGWYEIHQNADLKTCLATKWSPFCFHNELRFSTGLLPHGEIDAATSSETSDWELVRTR
ncbi:hypothetical protein [Streptomyces shenzhenensis]|uniref:hypothetical protein n=1 Tax=Streptomyces shenzhenensis TaxID=943815 RepID=UPI001F3F1887|nr:hypothetical protein [Streptomyces shenzhenensis]